jgi:ubiquinone/menaquinone biosynthesis C-methylase UbiE
MLRQGKKRGLAGVEWKTGRAENIPLDDGAVDVVWMSQVFHHLENTRLAFDEVRRVLRPSGWLAVRNGTRETDCEIEWLRCFPEAQAVDAERIPSRQHIVDAAATAGFQLQQKETVYQCFAASYAEYYRKITERGLSSLITISDEAFEAGLRRLRAWVDHQPAHERVYEPVDLFLFRRETV